MIFQHDYTYTHILAHTSAINNAVGPVRPAVAASPSPPSLCFTSYTSSLSSSSNRRSARARVRCTKIFPSENPSAGRILHTHTCITIIGVYDEEIFFLFSRATRFYLYFRAKTFDFRFRYSAVCFLIPPRRPFRQERIR